ncbi:hypothetical protein DS745_02225 [Anaerobacillus alkaliphilus]|uniref:Uncharacterized protein n=1 Tax=Anaerobacillus alkaliphilus TaxID=1548597 RepID=A0A4V1LGX2_9BACI|nr:hypothetical protein [Anaerobacillus alkaliphilus]RXJ04225.1 hypothetical protein DS745_02225 [Anaerobacillus alkaliphilus]
MKWYRFFLLMATIVLLVGCGEETNGGQENDTNSEIGQEAPDETETTDESTETDSNEETNTDAEQAFADPEHVADELVAAMDSQDMETIANLVHPAKGVRFSPYAYVHVDTDQVFSADEILVLMEDDTVYEWGVFDGSGYPIEMTFQEYFYRFVYDEDYANAEEKAVNERLGAGNTLDNTSEIYPDATVVEYHFTGFDPEFAGMDWRSLRLVFEELDGAWYLVGVIHDEWTI